ncbi:MULTISPECIES: hypothetical protein [unclassified Moorena]|uniref:hypothetical protein n=1 Tax=unclassified Moorena TaxID=2683338 RepID=UPI0013CDD295|nr:MULTISPECIES: hypothetical protein [unclassified Moorena]NEO24320.1 hypothetical protein [Moorena sp. SIO4A5]NEP26797.1 hypothetical protein [Moorena sp. SIO3I6]NEQ58012.1 hypothetical protein [Moorena sp. SIO4A1]
MPVPRLMPDTGKMPIPHSLFPIPYSLLPTPYSLLPTPYSLLPLLNHDLSTTIRIREISKYPCDDHQTNLVLFYCDVSDLYDFCPRQI